VRTLYVVGADRSLRGIVTLADLAGVPAADRAHTRVEQVMTPGERIATGDPEATTWSAFLQMAEREVNQLPVVERGRLLGAVTRQRLMAIAQASAALGQE
jgi:CBS domain-containing protein